MAWSCSPSYANECAKAIQAGAKRESIKFALLLHRISFYECLFLARRKSAYLKYRLASAHLLPEKYHNPTAYHVVAACGSCSTNSCASMNKEDLSR